MGLFPLSLPLGIARPKLTCPSPSFPLPNREVQLHHQLEAPPLSEWHVTYSYSLSSGFLLPFLMVLCVAILLLCCRHGRPQHITTYDPIPRSQSLNSLGKIHRRMSSVAMSALQVVGLDGSNNPPAPEYGRGNSGLMEYSRGSLGLTADYSRGSKLKFTV